MSGPALCGGSRRTTAPPQANAVRGQVAVTVGRVTRIFPNYAQLKAAVLDDCQAEIAQRCAAALAIGDRRHRRELLLAYAMGVLSAVGVALLTLGAAS